MKLNVFAPPMNLFLVASAAVAVADVECRDPDMVFDVLRSSSSLSVDQGHQALVERRFLSAR